MRASLSHLPNLFTPLLCIFLRTPVSGIFRRFDWQLLRLFRGTGWAKPSEGGRRKRFIECAYQNFTGTGHDGFYSEPKVWQDLIAEVKRSATSATSSSQ
jgi:hypothetical protein